MKIKTEYSANGLELVKEHNKSDANAALTIELSLACSEQTYFATYLLRNTTQIRPWPNVPSLWRCNMIGVFRHVVCAS